MGGEASVSKGYDGCKGEGSWKWEQNIFCDNEAVKSQREASTRSQQDLENSSSKILSGSEIKVKEDTAVI